jgi:uncharacterized protein with GYD domain
MIRFLVLIDYTPQGISKFSDTLSRAEGFAEAAKKAGVTVKSQYWTIGRHDGAMVLEAADEKAVTALLLKLGGEGNVRTHTLRAYDAGEMKTILSAAAK